MPLNLGLTAAIFSLICLGGVAPGHAAGRARPADHPGHHASRASQNANSAKGTRNVKISRGSKRTKALSPKAARAASAVKAHPVGRAPGSAAALSAQLPRRIAAAREALARLKSDPKRRVYRDGWEAIIRDLDSAVAAAPGSPQVVEAGLLSARAREELWGASRRKVDASAAIAAYRQVEARHPGGDSGQHALIAAIRLAHSVSDKKELAAGARRLSNYPRGSEVREALALAGAEEAPASRPAPAATPSKGGVAALLAQSRPVRPSDRLAQRPVDDEEEEAGPEVAKRPPAPAAPPVPAAAPLSSARASRAGRTAPPSPEREPDTDVPAEAAHVLDALVQAVRDRGAADLLGEPAASAPSGSNPVGPVPATPAAGALPVATPEATGKPAIATTPVEPASGRDDDPSPEPEETDEVTLPHRTRASAPRTFAADEADPDAEHKARTLRTALLGRGPSVAEQLGLKIRTIAVDAGHGGRDTGAIGPKGLREKDATLTIARKVAKRLKALGFKVVMTRDSDAYVGLSTRTRIANEAGADLFVSVHCNAARRRGLSGVETWTLNTTSDRYAQRLAAFENAEADATVGSLRLILADLATKANAGDARELATAVQASMVRTLRSRVGKVKDHGVKHALFYVLLGTHMPSILVETAFLSNPEEERRLRSPKYQDGTAEAISRGVKDFLDSRRRLARVQ